MDQKLTILDLIKNNTLNAEMAAFMWEAVSVKTSFLTAALYQNAGKSTLSKALLDLRDNNTPLHFVSENLQVTEKLLEVEKDGGYLVVSEFNPVEVPGYIWGEDAKKVFQLSKKGYSLQGCIHSSNAQDAIVKLTKENGITDEDASLIKLVLFIEIFGSTPATAKRRITQIYEVHYVENGLPMGHSIFEWDKTQDSFIKTEEAHLPGINKEKIKNKTQLIKTYVSLNKTNTEDVDNMLGELA